MNRPIAFEHVATDGKLTYRKVTDDQKWPWKQRLDLSDPMSWDCRPLVYASALSAPSEQVADHG